MPVKVSLQEDFLKTAKYLENCQRRVCLLMGRPKYKVIISNLLCILSVFIVGQQFYSLIYYSSIGHYGSSDVLHYGGTMAAFLCAALKMHTLNSRKYLFSKLLQHFREDIWELFLTELPETMSTLVQYTKKIKAMQKCFQIFWLPAFGFQLGPYLIGQFEEKVLGMEKRYHYPYDDRVYPFDKNKWYLVVYEWEVLTFFGVSCVFMAYYATLVTLVSYICMELSILGIWLKKLLNEEDLKNIQNNRNLRETQDKIKRNLNFVIQRYNAIVKLTDEYNCLMSAATLMSYSHASLQLAVCAYNFAVGTSRYYFVLNGFYMLSVLIEFGVLCNIGTDLSTKSAALSDSIYSCAWIYADHDTKKTLLNFMVRTQRPLQLTAIRLVTLDLETLKEVIIFTYNTYNLLRAMYPRT